MRILINGWFSDQLATGSGQYLASLTEWLPRVGGEHEFVVVRPCKLQIANCKLQIANRKQQIANSKSQIADAGTEHAPRTTQYASPLAKLWFEQVSFPLACRRLAADVAFVPYWAAPLWSPCPVVVTVHDLIPLLLPLYRGGLLQRGYTWLVSLTARRAAAVLTDSEASRRDIVAHLRIPAERVHAIHLAANPRYRPVTDPIALATIRAKYHLPDEPFLLYLGGFDARKNVRRTVKAYAQIANRKPVLSVAEGSQIALVIAGKLPERDMAFAPDPRLLVRQLGIEDRVHFTGWVDEADKPALYSMALGVLFASEYEGFGLQVLEAMACNNESRD